jgi:hypothetical protein
MSGEKMKKKYKVLVSFKWRGAWVDVGSQLDLLNCEAQSLLQTQKIEEVKAAKKGAE